MTERLCVEIRGAVQGVGFRPFVYRLAKELELKGFVINDTRGVYIEVEGERKRLEEFFVRLSMEKPPLARIHSINFSFSQPVGYSDFEIRESSERGQKEVFVLPDMATCEDCLRELFDPSDRRYLYPFINCTNCGPRFTIIEGLPYDRPNTTMKVFKMCKDCEREYHDPRDRRFHAQPNACPVCGPWISLYSSDGTLIAERQSALEVTVRLLREGKILAVKGLGGFHLMCDARREEVVGLLRERKRRKEKPFAVMFKDLEQLTEYAEVSQLEKALLLLPERPIVLIGYKGGLAPSVAPKLKRLGAFLPYSPLHHLILKELEFPVVATSGNLSDEPIVKDNHEAMERLSKLADYILLHNRDIKRRCDDSVVKVIGGMPTPIRRSRGYAPMPVTLPFSLKRRVLAVGGMLKNTFALGFSDRVIISQHVGDVENLETLRSFEEMVLDLMELYQFEPEVVVCDMHPRYETARWAENFSRERNIPIHKLQHHHAHVLSCMAENQLEGRVLGIAWDGTGYGGDGSLWGGEFLECGYTSFKRLFHFRTFRLIGGERAVKEPRRVALSLLFELFGEKAMELEVPTLRAFEKKELENLYIAWGKGINSPLTSSVGRLFDGVASLLGLAQTVSYEGQASMFLEDLYMPDVEDSYSFDISETSVDWRPTILAILEEKDKRLVPSRFINTLAMVCLEVAKRVGIERVCLSGGVMQNDPMVSKIKRVLEREGFEVYVHQKVPPNDGGLSLGQAVYGGLLEEL